jgi:hypothetical protein
MIRQLCFAAVAVLFAASTCSANFVIDDFSGVATATPSASGVTITANTFTTTSGSSYQGVGASSYSITYDFGGTLLSLAQAETASITSDSLTSFLVPSAPVLANSFSLTVAVDGLTQILSPAGANPFVTVDAPGGGTTFLADTTSLTLTWTDLGGGATVDFGGATAFTAVPEPTSLLMFPAAIGLVLAGRRRKN